MTNPLTQFKTDQDIQQPTAIGQLAQVEMGFGSAQGFELMQRGAKLLAASSLVPKEYINNIPNCSIALNMATRLRADPLLVMQNLYLVHGRPGWSAKFLIATFNQCGRFTTARYEKKGVEGEMDYGVRAWATELATGERVEGPWITWRLVNDENWLKKAGSKWQTMPEKMFMYRAAAWMIDTHAPELSMGISTVEELHDAFDQAKDVTAKSTATGLRDKLGKLADTTPIDEDENVDIKTGEVLPKTTEEKTDADAVKVSYTDVANALKTANTLDDLNEAADLIRSVKNPTHREQLNEFYDDRKAVLNQVTQ
jgi:hypothetical protein